jgi:DNA gyrase subunit A
MAVRFEETDVRPMGRVAARRARRQLEKRRFRRFRLRHLERRRRENPFHFRTGFGKQTKANSYRLTKRGGKGVINMKTTAKTGKVVAAFQVEEDSEIMIITQQAKLIRLGVDKIRETGRSAQGVMLIRTGADDLVTSASKLEVPMTMRSAKSAKSNK